MQAPSGPAVPMSIALAPALSPHCDPAPTFWVALNGDPSSDPGIAFLLRGGCGRRG